MALKRLPTAQLEEESRLAVHAVVNEMNCQFRPLLPDTSGIDGEIELVHGVALTGRVLKCQIKAGPSYLSAETDDHFKVRVERKYLEHWASMDIPVVLLYYHPATRTLYWKSIQDYLKIDRSLLNRAQKSFSIPFDKTRDAFTDQSVGDLWLVANKEFAYTKVVYSDGPHEHVASNWFRVLALPHHVYSAPTWHTTVTNITSQVQGLYSCTIRDRRLYSLSSLFDEAVELRKHCDHSKVTDLGQEGVDHSLYVDLLNQVVKFNLGRMNLLLVRDRYHFSPSLLRNPADNVFEYPGLKGQPEQRKKIYVSTEEMKHHAVRLKFHRLSSDWFLEMEPTWYFSYPQNIRKTRLEIGARITKEMADTVNKDYLYLLHFWRQFLSRNSPNMVFPCDSTPTAQMIAMDCAWLSAECPFRLVNDYEGPARGEREV